jgi:hypothetical protein
VSSSPKRIAIDGRDFLWSVYEEWEEAGPVTLAVSSTDRRFLVRYQIHQPDGDRYITVLGREFGGLPERRNSLIRVRCPILTSGEAIRPSDVRRLVQWCLRPKAELVQVDWDGRDTKTA